MPNVLKSNVDYAIGNARARDNKPYGYGGTWHPTDLSRTTDCSGIVTHTLDGVVNGSKMTWSRHGLSTEAYRYVGPAGSKGPFGTIRCTRGTMPANAVVKIGLQHGAGGGRNSHMACTLMGVNIESSGSYGQRIGGPARGWDHSMFGDFFYLPGDLAGSGATVPVTPRAPGAVYLGINDENVGPRVLKLQQTLNSDYPAYSHLDEDGEYGPATATVISEFQRRKGISIDGTAGPATLAALGLSFQVQPVPAVLTLDQKVDKLLVDVGEIRKQLEGAGDPSWPKEVRGFTVRDLIYKLARRSGDIS